jgi:hypothetical protein
VSAKKTFVLRIDEETFKALEKWAADEFRSVNGQIEWIIDDALKEARRKKQKQSPESKAKKTE